MIPTLIAIVVLAALGELIEFSAVALHFPPFLRRIPEGFAIEAQYPVGLGDLDLVAEPRRFAVLQRAHAGYRTIPVDADDEFDGAAVAVGCGDGQNDGDDFAAFLAM